MRVALKGLNLAPLVLAASLFTLPALSSEATSSEQTFVAKSLHPSVATTGSFMLPETKTKEPLLYVSDWGHNTVTLFSQSRPGEGPVGRIAGLIEPTGIAIDANHDLWVQSGMGATGTQIEAFRRGSTTPYISFGGGGGVGIAFDAHGNLYVTTARNEIDVYAPGAKTPTQRIVDSGIDYLWAVAVDKSGHVFCEGSVFESSGPPQIPVDELTQGGAKVRRLIPSLGTEGGLAVAPNGDLFVQDGNTISTYGKPYTARSIKRIVTRDTGAYLALSSTFLSVWIAAAHGPDGQGQQYNLRSGRLTHWTERAGMSSVVLGVALDPPAAI